MRFPQRQKIPIPSLGTIDELDQLAQKFIKERLFFCRSIDRFHFFKAVLAPKGAEKVSRDSVCYFHGKMTTISMAMASMSHNSYVSHYQRVATPCRTIGFRGFHPSHVANCGQEGAADAVLEEARKVAEDIPDKKVWP